MTASHAPLTEKHHTGDEQSEALALGLRPNGGLTIPAIERADYFPRPYARRPAPRASKRACVIMTPDDARRFSAISARKMGAAP